MKIYTDASTRVTKGISGLAFVMTDEKNNIIQKKATIVNEQDNNTAELRAILYALSQVKSTKEHITLFTDSSYAINAIRNNIYRQSEEKIIQYIHKNLNRLNCNIFWIKGHCHDGTVLSYFNKMADKGAKRVRKQYEQQLIKDKKAKRKNINITTIVNNKRGR